MLPAQAPPAAASGRTKIFISYRRKDFAGATVAELLYDALAKRFSGKRVFMDIGSLKGGDPFREDIAAALALCRALLIVIGPQWLDATDEHGRRRLDDPSDIVRWEIFTALRRGILVIPVLVQGTPLPRKEELPDALKPLSEYQAAVIQSGRMDEDIEELVGLLRRRLRRLGRRIRRAVAVAEVELLGVTITLLCFFSTAAMPVALSPEEGDTVLPEVSHQLGQELFVEGLTEVGAGGPILRYDGLAVADLRVDLESGRASDKTLGDLEPSNPHWGQDWAHVAYNTAGRARESAPDYDRACSTFVEVKAARDTEPPTWIRFFQRNTPPNPSAYREVELRADRELAVTLKTVPPKGGDADGPGCSKRLRFGGDPSATALQDSAVEVYAAPESALTFRFAQRDQDMVSGRKDFMRFGEPPNDTIEPFTLMVAPLRARAIKVRPYDDKDTAKVIFNASSAGEFLLLRSLSVGPDYLRFALEGRAYVRGENLSSSLRGRITQNLAPAVILLITAVGLVVSLAYTLARL